MTEDLTDILSLKDILGYKDKRSVISWCSRNNIQLIKIGVRIYIQNKDLRFFIDKQLALPNSENYETSKASVKKANTGVIKSYYKSNNEIVSKYLAKYESDNKTKVTKKT